MQTNFISATNIKTCFNLNTSYGKNKTITAVGTIKFLDLKINYHLKLYKEHTDLLSAHLIQVYFCHEGCHTTLNNMYFKVNLFAYLHSTISYGVAFWKNQIDSKKCFPCTE